MKTILIDAINGLVLEDGSILEPMHQLLESYSNNKLVLTGANDEQFKQFKLDQAPYEVFTLKHNPDKTDPQYFKILFEKYGLTANDVVYFEHNAEAARTAQAIGIPTYFYDHTKADMTALKQFLDKNLTGQANLDMQKINASIADRSDVFYWQTDRAVEPQEAGLIWADRHRYFSDSELLKRVNGVLGDDKLASIEPLNLDAQTNLGNVNSVRVGRLVSGNDVIIRCHPKGVLNGYFHAEAAASHKAKAAGLPSFDTLAIHEYEGGDDFAFHVLEKLPGTAIKRWLEAHPDDESVLLSQIGMMMARLHQVEVDGFGPFDNERAKKGELVGLHRAFGEAVRAGLAFNLDVLVKEAVLTVEQSTAINKLFADGNPLLATSKAVLVHNDFADWNLLTDGTEVTGILDWDECVGGDPISDIACWSTFFKPERLQPFLEGYWQVAQKPADFRDRFELLRLRYVLSKMTLRIRRYSWDPSDFMRGNIETGKTHLDQSMEYFGI